MRILFKKKMIKIFLLQENIIHIELAPKSFQENLKKALKRAKI